MSRSSRWVVRVGAVAVAIAAGVGAWALWCPQWECLGGDGPGERVEPEAPPEPPKPRKRAFRLPRPDQPGWTARPTAEEYGMGREEFVAAYHRSRHLGEPQPVEGAPGIVRVEPYRVAALVLEDSAKAENRVEEFVLAERIVTRLRQARVPAFGNPVLVYFLEEPGEPETWEDRADIFVGIPVAPGVEVPDEFRVIEVPGGEALAGASQPRVVGGAEPEWAALAERARHMGREPQSPLVVRFSGWRKRPPLPQFQALLFLKPKPVEPSPSADP